MIGAGSAAAASFSSNRSSGLDTSALSAPWSSLRGTPNCLTCSVASNAIAGVTVHEGGFSALQPVLQSAASTAAIYGVLPYRNAGTLRHCFFCFIPPSLTGMARARISLQKAAVYAAFEGVVGDLTLDDPAACTAEAIVAALSRLPSAQGIELP